MIHTGAWQQWIIQKNKKLNTYVIQKSLSFLRTFVIYNIIGIFKKRFKL